MSIFKQQLKWPHAKSPLEEPGFDSLNVNGTPYHKVEVTPDKWEWRVDLEGVKIQNTEDNHKKSLAYALQTRVLSADEMNEVDQYGMCLFIRNMQSYTPLEIQKEFNEAILQQYRLRNLPIKQKE